MFNLESTLPPLSCQGPPWKPALALGFNINSTQIKYPTLAIVVLHVYLN